MTALRFRYQTYEFDGTDIHVRTLRDRQQFNDDDGIAEALGICSASWPLFGVVWPSSEILAKLMYQKKIKGKRILEVGCGIGLASLVLNHRQADITATDLHPEVQGFMFENTELNHDREIPFIRTSWVDEISQLGKFDLIIGSDLLYEVEHIKLLSDFINQHAANECEVIIIDPGRKQHARFSKMMMGLGYTFTKIKPDDSILQDQIFTGYILNFHRSK